jgi:hypothetical protein
MPEVSVAKKRSITAFRRKFELCEQCGCVEKDLPHVCYENYVKADMTKEDLKKSDVISTTRVGISEDEKINEDLIVETNDVSEEEKKDQEAKSLELTSKIKTVISYRGRKSLCLSCGKVDQGIEHECVEDYEQADMRSEEEKDEDPRTIHTPKEQKQTISEQEKVAAINEEFLKNTLNPMFELSKTQALTIQRDYIMLDLTKSPTGQKFDVGYIEYMSHKYKNMIIFIIGDIEKIYTYKELIMIKKIANVCPIVNLMKQNIINYLHGCKHLFSFPSDYITYCMVHDINATVFFDNSSKYTLPCGIVDIPTNMDVDRVVVAKNAVAWRV